MTAPAQPDRLLVLRPNPAKWLVVLGASAGFVLLGALFFDERPALGWMTFIFFGLGVLISLIQLVPGSASLTLRPAGFTMRVLFRDRFIPWSDVQGFFVLSVRTGHSTTRMVGFNYVPGSASRRRRAAFSRWLTNADDGLRDTYG